MIEVIKYVVGVIAAIALIKISIHLLGAMFGSFAGLLVLALIGWLIYRTLNRRRAS